MAGKYRTEAMADITSQAANAAVAVSDLDDKFVLVTGTFVGTYSVECSHDGVNFDAHEDHTGETGPKFCAIPDACSHVRVNCTAFTSGTISSVLTGKDADRLG